MGKHGIILFGHGARDPRWKEPFERLAAKLRSARGDQPVTLAFLELMSPDLPSAVASLIDDDGCDAVTVVPVFFGQGGHVRRDLPEIVEKCRSAHPGVVVDVATAVGEDDAVLDAVAAYCLRSLS